jgi:hypothetical protein
MKKFLIYLKIKLFKPINLSKIIVIFLVGISSRYLINNYFNVNVFIEYSSYISILYYSFFSAFIVFISELFSFYNINIIPGFIFKLFDIIAYILHLIFIKPFIYFYTYKNLSIHYMYDPKYNKNDGNIKFNRNYYVKDGKLHHYEELGESSHSSYKNRIIQDSLDDYNYFKDAKYNKKNTVKLESGNGKHS